MLRTVTRAVFPLVALVAVQPAGADFDAGQRAWDAGSVDEALRQWQAAANEGGT